MVLAITSEVARGQPVFADCRSTPSRVDAEFGVLLLAAREDERRAISSELHDCTVQHLVAAELSVQRLKQHMPKSGETVAVLADIEQCLEMALRELRASTYLLHPAEILGGNLSAALERYCAEFERRTGIAVQVTHDRSAELLPPAAQCAILRIVQEGLANVHRHVHSATVRVRLRKRNGCLHLIVSNDGHAKAVGEVAAAHSGVGLSSIRYRLLQLGGTFTISCCRRGTVLHGIIPLP